MPAYDSAHFEPPAPLAYVAMRHLDSGVVQTDVQMLLDSGADVTLVPLAAVEQLGATLVQGKQYELRGFGGSVTYAPVVRLELLFCNRAFRGQFLVLDQAWGILGRNVLNAIPVLLDGPHLTWDEHRPV